MVLLAGCARAPLPTPGRSPCTWDVGVAIANGDRTLEAIYSLSTEPLDRGVWRVATVRTQGTWESSGTVESFDSASPTGADPWPLTLQHLVAAVPADVRMEGGRATEIMGPDDWSQRARAAIYASNLPVEAVATGEPLVDPAGLLADLERSFPGLPPDGDWIRSEKMAGVAARRTETCTSAATRSERTWDCEGIAEADGSARFFEVRTWTRIAADRLGMSWMETGYSGTLVLMAPDGASALDRPIAGLRRIERR